MGRGPRSGSRKYPISTFLGPTMWAISLRNSRENRPNLRPTRAESMRAKRADLQKERNFAFCPPSQHRLGKEDSKRHKGKTAGIVAEAIATDTIGDPDSLSRNNSNPSLPSSPSHPALPQSTHPNLSGLTNANAKCRVFRTQGS